MRFANFSLPLQGGHMSKNHENRRKLHAAQLAKQMNKQNEHQDSSSAEGGLVNQYKVIREDLMKLRDDLSRGYDMAKEAVDKKTFLSELMKLRENF